MYGIHVLLAVLVLAQYALVQASRCGHVYGCYCPDYSTIRCPGDSPISFAVLKRCLQPAGVRIIDLRGRLFVSGIIGDISNYYTDLETLDLRTCPCTSELLREISSQRRFTILHSCDAENLTWKPEVTTQEVSTGPSTARPTLTFKPTRSTRKPLPPINPMTTAPLDLSTLDDLTSTLSESTVATKNPYTSQGMTTKFTTQEPTTQEHTTDAPTTVTTGKPDNSVIVYLKSTDFLLRVVLPASVVLCLFLGVALYKLLKWFAHKLAVYCCPTRLFRGSSTSLFTQSAAQGKLKTSDENLQMDGDSEREINNESLGRSVNIYGGPKAEATDQNANNDGSENMSRLAEISIPIETIGAEGCAIQGGSDDGWLFGMEQIDGRPVNVQPQRKLPGRYNPDDKDSTVPPPPQPNPKDLYTPSAKLNPSHDMFAFNLATRVKVDKARRDKVIKMGLTARKQFEKRTTQM